MEFEKSLHNIFSKLEDSDDFFILNLLSKNADILDSKNANEYKTGIFTNESEWIKKGYLVNPEKERLTYKHAYLDFIKNSKGGKRAKKLSCL